MNSDFSLFCKTGQNSGSGKGSKKLLLHTDKRKLWEVHLQQTNKLENTDLQLQNVQNQKSQDVIIGKNEILHLCNIMKRKYSY